MRTTAEGWASYDVDDLCALGGDGNATLVALYLLARTRYLRAATCDALQPGLARECEERFGMSRSTVARALRRIETSDRWIVWRARDGKVLGVELVAGVVDATRPPGAVAQNLVAGRHPWHPRVSPVTPDTYSPESLKEREEAGAGVKGDARGPGPTRGAEVVRQLRARTRRKTEPAEATPEAPPAAALG